MPKEQAITITSAKKRWTVASYTVEPGAVDPTAGTLFIDVRVETITDTDRVEDASIRHVVSGPAMQALLVDVAARLMAYATSGQPAAAAYYLGTRDALYAQLQADGVIPKDAV